MTHTRMAPIMGLMMGAMLPFMLHGAMAGAGIAFVLAHVAVALGLLAAVLIFPAMRARLAKHRPNRRVFVLMTGAALVGFGLVCVHCLVTGHVVPAWVAA